MNVKYEEIPVREQILIYLDLQRTADMKQAKEFKANCLAAGTTVADWDDALLMLASFRF
jgi:hypothetical protein